MIVGNVRTGTLPSMVRLVLVYVGVVTVGVWARFLFDEVGQGTELSRAVVAAFGTAFGEGPVPVAVVAILLLPGMVLSVELGSRAGAMSALPRAGTGMAAWAAWGLALALIGSGLSRVVLLPNLVASQLVLLATGGAVFALLALDGHPIAGRRRLIAVGLVAAGFVVGGALVMAGRWSSAV